VARTRLDLAAVKARRGQVADATRDVAEARAAFVALEVPRWVARADELGRTLGVA
jgi:hypothetical protein